MSTQNYQYWVVFSGQADMAWLRILKPGFRHCAILVNDGERWMSLDPLSNYMDVTTHDVPIEFNMPLWMEDRGHKVIKAENARPAKAAPWGVFTCVEAVKRVLGIHNRFIITPWQLYRHLSGKSRGVCQDTHTPFFKGDLAWEV